MITGSASMCPRPARWRLAVAPLDSALDPRLVEAPSPAPSRQPRSIRTRSPATAEYARQGAAKSTNSRRRRPAPSRIRIPPCRRAASRGLLASGERSEAISHALGDMEAHKATEQQGIDALAEVALQPIRLPSPDEVMVWVLDLEGRIDQDPLAAREELRRYLDGAKPRDR
jgi:hypothetical protein